VITMIASIAQWAAFLSFTRNDDESGNAIGNIVEFAFLVVLAPLAATVIQLGISRSREFRADETGGGISGNPLALASALEKIECYAQKKILLEATPATSHMFIINPFSGNSSWLRNLFSTHPATSDRVARLTELSKHGR